MVPLRWHLVVLVVGALAPVVVFAGVMIVRNAEQERDAMKRRLVAAAEAMAADLDREIMGTQRTLVALAESHHFDTGDYAAFNRDARRMMTNQPYWLAIIVWGTDASLLADTEVPDDAPRVKIAQPETLTAVLETGKPVIGWLGKGTRNPIWAFPIRVPVIRDGQIQCVLTAVIRSDALARLVSVTSPKEEWTRSVVDPRGTVAARSLDPVNYVGLPARADFVARLGQSPRGLFADTTREGLDVHMAYCRAPVSGWTVVVSAPREYVEAPVRRSALVATALGLAVIAVSALIPWVVARRVEQGIAASAQAASALAQGAAPTIPPSSVAEVTALGDALTRSGELLRQRARERDEHLASALAAGNSLRQLNETLEQRVAQRTALAEERAAQLRLVASQLAQAEQRERRRVAHILHEHFQQVLVAARMQLACLRERAVKAGMQAEIDRVTQLLASTIEESRTLAVELSPPVLDSFGLAAGLAWLAQSMQERYGLSVKVDADASVDPLPEDTRLLLYHAARELLFNVVKHAGVTQARVMLCGASGRIRLVVEDLGKGFDAHAIDANRKSGGLGLFSLRERLSLRGGTLETTTTVGQGTRVVLEIPAENPAVDGRDTPMIQPAITPTPDTPRTHA